MPEETKGISSLVQAQAPAALLSEIEQLSGQQEARFVTVAVNNVPLTAKINTGAKVSAVPASFLEIPSSGLHPTEVLFGTSGHALQVLGKFDAAMRWKDKPSR